MGGAAVKDCAAVTVKRLRAVFSHAQYSAGCSIQPGAASGRVSIRPGGAREAISDNACSDGG